MLTIRNLLVFFVGILLPLLLVSCMQDTKPSPEVAESIYLANPEPPYKWYPFDDYPLTEIDKEAGRTTSFWNTWKLNHKEFENQFFDREFWQIDHACLSRVKSLTVNLTGNISGKLSFNQKKRMKRVTIPELNDGNTKLGGVYKSSGFLETAFYKYEVVVEFDSLVEAFYGQMISGAFGSSTTKPIIEFHDDSPANDWANLKWDLDTAAGEKKDDFPVLEVQGNTVRWIDAPQATNFSIPGQNYVIVYAGVCGAITHMEIIEINYVEDDPKDPNENGPHARIISKEEFRDAVDSWSFR